MYTGPPDDEPSSRDTASYREELSREERSKRRDQASWVVIGWVMAAALALLSYDSGGAALAARRSGRPWVYPACISLVCFLLLVALVVRAVTRRRRKVSYRGPG
jgi:hypothetical protein